MSELFPVQRQIDRLVRELLKLGEDDAMCGSWEPADRALFLVQKRLRVRAIRKVLYSIATGPA